MVDSDKYLDISDRSLHDPSFEHIARDIRPPGTSPICIRGEHGCHDRRVSGAEVEIRRARTPGQHVAIDYRGG